jgi:uncharacterized damage-inducible protein DinB
VEVPSRKRGGAADRQGPPSLSSEACRAPGSAGALHIVRARRARQRDPAEDGFRGLPWARVESPEAAILTTESLAKDFRRNLSIVEAQTKGLAHQDALVQVPGANCLNWVLGHIANSRDEVLSLLGEGPALGEATARYRRESDPVTADGPGVVPLERLLAALAEGQERIAAALAALAEEALADERRSGDRTLPLGAMLHFAMWHETYHVGQTELLRALAGKRDKVI